MTLERKVLVVDDDDAIRTLLATVLRRRGLRVDTARNGQEAVAMLAASHYSMVLLDLMMPLMSGYQLLEHLADQSLSSRPWVLVLTAAGHEPRVLDTSFVVGTMHKPFDVELLVDTVLGCLKVAAPVPPDAAGMEGLNPEKPN